MSEQSQDSQTPQTDAPDLSSISPELRKVIEFDDIPTEMHNMVISIHEVSEQAVRDAWEELPASAQNVLDNFEQFHALISVSQAFAGVNFMDEFKKMQLPKDMTDEEQEAYRTELLDGTLYNCVKDMVKQIKKARRDVILKKDINSIFKK